MCLSIQHPSPANFAPSLQAFLEQLHAAPFAQLTHAEAVSLLRRRGDLSSPPRPDGDLSREHELALLEHTGNAPVFVTDWPAALKPFYMRPSGESTVSDEREGRVARGEMPRGRERCREGGGHVWRLT